ncbi:zinc-binding dehydrogenase [Marisediminicola senii]|uniref:zinc-binding dehydrogenase n=1 Tax=Marisediminicola senii TaxID=2711233 RepID=UPI0013EAB7D6|nr:zinc-binding dehydrogenase [Marisediminicola senii]
MTSPNRSSSTSPSAPTVALEAILPSVVEPDGVELRQRTLANPESGELLVAVEATGISAAEKAMRLGRYYGQPAFPFVPGYDLVGTVTAVPADGDPSLIGARVACLTKTGGWATHAIVPARDAVRVPDDISSVDAEAVIVNGVTAVQMLRKARVSAGQTVLVQGAGSGVGGILVQLAQRAGVRVIGTASPRHHDALRERGVEPLDYADPALAEKVAVLAPQGVAAVFDNVSGPMMYTAWRMVAPGGMLLCYSIMSIRDTDGSPAGPYMKAIAQLTAWNLLPNRRRAAFYNIWDGHRIRPARYRAALESDLAELFELLRTGAIVPEIAAEFSLENVRAAFAFAEARTTSGKVILRP